MQNYNGRCLAEEQEEEGEEDGQKSNTCRLRTAECGLGTHLKVFVLGAGFKFKVQEHSLAAMLHKKLLHASTGAIYSGSKSSK